MGLVCKYWTMFLEFLKKRHIKFFWPDLWRKKSAPGGDGRGSHLLTRPTDGPGAHKYEDFHGKSWILRQKSWILRGRGAKNRK